MVFLALYLLHENPDSQMGHKQLKCHEKIHKFSWSMNNSLFTGHRGHENHEPIKIKTMKIQVLFSWHYTFTKNNP